jgi:hypothetical protein
MLKVKSPMRDLGSFDHAPVRTSARLKWTKPFQITISTNAPSSKSRRLRWGEIQAVSQRRSELERIPVD